MQLDPKADCRPWPLAGYAPGNYTCKCIDCEERFSGDKRAIRCLECAAVVANQRLQAVQPVPVLTDDGVDRAIDRFFGTDAVFTHNELDQHRKNMRSALTAALAPRAPEASVEPKVLVALRNEVKKHYRDGKSISWENKFIADGLRDAIQIVDAYIRSTTFQEVTMPSDSEIDALIERLSQFEGRDWETTVCYNGLRLEAAAFLAALRDERDGLERGLRTVQNAAKTIASAQGTELEHLRQNRTYDYKLRQEHESLLERDAQMTDALLTAEARVRELEQKLEQARGAVRIADGYLEVAQNDAERPLYNELEVGFRHSPLSPKETIQRYRDASQLCADFIRRARTTLAEIGQRG